MADRVTYGGSKILPFLNPSRLSDTPNEDGIWNTKTHPQESLFPAGAKSHTISSCNADTRTSKQGGSLPIDDFVAQVPPGGDKQ